MPSIYTITASVACLASMALAAPTYQQTQDMCTAGSKTMPIMYSIYPARAQQADLNTVDINLQNAPTPGQWIREQVVAFEGIPKDAKTCSLHWNQAAKSERSFVVVGNGSTRVRPFYQFPAAEGACYNSAEGDKRVTYASTKPLSDLAPKELSPDFSFWPDSEAATQHTAGEVPCAENIYLHVRLHRGADANQTVYDGDVKFKQDANNGWELKWTC